MADETTYTQTGRETPLERAARAEAQGATPQGAEAEREADVAVGDVDEYVARTHPSELAQAEVALNDWQIPTNPLEGVPGDVALHPGEDGEPLVSVFSARTESEANIVRGLVEAEGIAVIFREVATPAYGSIFSVSESRWADLLVAPAQAQAARDAIASAIQDAAATAADESPVSDDYTTVPGP